MEPVIIIRRGMRMEEVLEMRGCGMRRGGVEWREGCIRLLGAGLWVLVGWGRKGGRRRERNGEKRGSSCEEKEYSGN